MVFLDSFDLQTDDHSVSVKPNGQIVVNSWRDIYQREDRMPGRGDISPRALKSILPLTAIVDMSDGVTANFSLVGTAIVHRNGFEPTGKNWKSFLSGDEADLFDMLLRQMEAGPYGIWYCAHIEPKSRNTIYIVESTTVPLFKDNRLAGMLTAEDEVNTNHFFKNDGWGRGGYKIIEVGLFDIGFGLPAGNFNFKRKPE